MQTKKLKALIHNYPDGNLVEQSYKVLPLSHMFQRQGVTGVSRLFILPAFEPEKIITFMFKASVIEIELVTSKTQVWNSLMQSMMKSRRQDGTESESASFTFDFQDVKKSFTRLSFEETPDVFGNWIEFLAMAKRATSCETPLTMDGVLYRHKVWGHEENIDALWNNPNIEKHLEQTTLIQAYFQCLSMGGLEGEKL